MLRLENIKIREDLKIEDIVKIAFEKNKIDCKDVIKYTIFKRSVDARKKEDIFYNYTIDVRVRNESKYKKIKHIEEKIDKIKIEKNRKSNLRPIIVGAGPAGLFCALTLVDNGEKPIIIEQGKKVEDRKKDVEEFTKSGNLNVKCNIQFGEGGAGTFSDGKLTTGLHDPLCRLVLKRFVEFGVPEQIQYINKPHIGTDNLINVIANIRKYIESKGGEFLFDEKFVDFENNDGNVKKAITDKREISTDTIVLAIGHSARDTFEMLNSKNIKMEKKNFSVGVRVEHKQEMINESQYGKKTKLKLPAAEYKLVYHNKDTGRSCYSFCMCPGGYVMASSSEPNTIVTNGMSKFARDGENANSAILVNVTPDDFKGESPLEGMYFQKELEEKAFALGGKNYFAPVQRVVDFIENKKSEKLGNVKPTYKPGVTLSNLNEILPEYVSTTLKEGLEYFDKKIQGFANGDAILTGVETRSSSPVRIIRGEDFSSVSIDGLYLAGEGPGYAGGIMSAAVDGMKCAIKILEK